MDYPNVNKSYVSNKNTDSAANRMLEHWRDRADYHFPQFRYCDQHIDDPAYEHHRHGFLPRKIKPFDHGERKERIQPYAGRQSIRDIGKKAHNQCADDRCDDRCQKHSAPWHPCCSEHVRVNCDNICHRKKCC